MPVTSAAVKPVLTVLVNPKLANVAASAVLSVNSSLLKMPNKVWPAHNLTITFKLPEESKTLLTSCPEIPCSAVYNGPAKVVSVPSLKYN